MVNCKNYTEQGGAVTHFGGKVIFEEGCEVEGLPNSDSSGTKAENQVASTATTVAGLKEDLNALLSKLKAAGVMEEDTQEPAETVTTDETTPTDEGGDTTTG